MSERFFVDCVTNQAAALEGPEAHHLLHVMRAKVGNQATLFDGSGGEWPATITAVGRSRVEFAVGERQEIDRELPAPIVFGVAMPKGDRQKWLVEKLTELGVTRLVPLVTERGGALSKAELKRSPLDKLRRAVVEASKQCGRNRLMEIGEPMPLATFLQGHDGVARWIAHPDGGPLDHVASTFRVVVAIGPEGGFSPAEFELAERAGWRGVSLGPRILRVETAAAAMATLLTVDC